MRFLAGVLLTLLCSSTAQADSTTTQLAKFIRQACRELADSKTTDEVRVSRMGKLLRAATITEHVSRPIPRWYFATPLLDGWEVFLEPGQISTAVPSGVTLTLADLERTMGRATEQQDEVHARLRALDPNKAVIRPESGTAMPPPQRVYEYRNLGTSRSCTATVYLEGRDETTSPRRYRITRIEILD